MFQLLIMFLYHSGLWRPLLVSMHFERKQVIKVSTYIGEATNRLGNGVAYCQAQNYKTKIFGLPRGLRCKCLRLSSCQIWSKWSIMIIFQKNSLKFLMFLQFSQTIFFCSWLARFKGLFFNIPTGRILFWEILGSNVTKSKNKLYGVLFQVRYTFSPIDQNTLYVFVSNSVGKDESVNTLLKQQKCKKSELTQHLSSIQQSAG